MKKLLSFYSCSGRATRSTWWGWQIIGSLYLGFVLAVNYFGPAGVGLVLVLLCLSLPFIAKVITVSVQRLHDTGRSAWWLLIIYVVSLVPLVGLLGLLFGLWLLGIKAGDQKENRYGPVPGLARELSGQSRETARANAHDAYLRAVENRENQQR